jgi:hypothetical protein
LARENENVTDKLGLTIYKHSQWGKKMQRWNMFWKDGASWFATIYKKDQRRKFPLPRLCISG